MKKKLKKKKCVCCKKFKLTILKGLLERGKPLIICSSCWSKVLEE